MFVFAIIAQFIIFSIINDDTVYADNDDTTFDYAEGKNWDISN